MTIERDPHPVPPTSIAPGEPLVMPNAWDAGSAKLFASLGFAAIATTSSGFAATLGRADGGVSADEAIAHTAALAAATPLPVNADLEDCFADDPGRRGGDDHGGRGGRRGRGVGRGLPARRRARPIHDIGLATDRVAAAAEAARASGLVLTARAENLIHGVRDLDDTIRRLQAYQEAGADVLYAPGLFTVDGRARRRRRRRPSGQRAAAPAAAPTSAALAEAGVGPHLGRRDAGLGRRGAPSPRPPASCSSPAHRATPTSPQPAARPRRPPAVTATRPERRRVAWPRVGATQPPFARRAADARVQHGVEHDADGDHPERQVRRVLAGQHGIEHERRQQRRPRPQDQHAAAVAVAEVHQAVVEMALVGDVDRLALASPGARWRTAGRARARRG